MRVVHVIKVVGVAGAERHLLLLAAGLRARGTDTRILTLEEPRRPVDAFARYAAAQGIPHERMEIGSNADVTVTRRLRRAFVEQRPDVVHTHLLHADLFGIPAARLARVPVVVTTRHNDNAFRRAVPVALTNRGLWAMVDAGITISEALRRFSVEVEGAPPRKLRTIYYGLDYKADPAARAERRAAARPQLGAVGDAPVVGMVCRLIEQKGVVYGLRAFARVAPRFPDARLAIVGDGPLRAALHNEARRLSIAERTHFLGWRADADALWAGLDVLLMPSLWEGFGLVLLEAMANGVPVVGSAVSAIPEVIVNGETGRLVPARDPAALGDALAELLGDRALRAYMGMMGEDRLETHFSAGRMVDETLALYRALARK